MFRLLHVSVLPINNAPQCFVLWPASAFHSCIALLRCTRLHSTSLCSIPFYFAQLSSILLYSSPPNRSPFSLPFHFFFSSPFQPPSIYQSLHHSSLSLLLIPLPPSYIPSHSSPSSSFVSAFISTLPLTSHPSPPFPSPFHPSPPFPFPLPSPSTASPCQRSHIKLLFVDNFILRAHCRLPGVFSGLWALTRDSRVFPRLCARSFCRFACRCCCPSVLFISLFSFTYLIYFINLFIHHLIP